MISSREITPKKVDSDFWAIRNAVAALKELADLNRGEYQRTLEIVSKNIDTVMAATAEEIANNIKIVIESVEAEKALLAGKGADQPAERDDLGCLTTAHTTYGNKVVKKIDIERLGERKAWQLKINDEEVAGVVIGEDRVKQIFYALDKWLKKKENPDDLPPTKEYPTGEEE